MSPHSLTSDDCKHWVFCVTSTVHPSTSFSSSTHEGRRVKLRNGHVGHSSVPRGQMWHSFGVGGYRCHRQSNWKLLHVTVYVQLDATYGADAYHYSHVTMRLLSSLMPCLTSCVLFESFAHDALGHIVLCTTHYKMTKHAWQRISPRRPAKYISHIRV